MMSQKLVPQVAIIVTIADSHLPHIEEVRQSLVKHQMCISQVLATVGMITGKVDSSKIPRLRQVEGVQSVELDGEVHSI